ncbi:YifB family Mg chelatase-like AAA ATPase [Acetobacteraceae bacterium H6797]|nr:YifB family Mg chelatase-like AAA ATPase [Acetobacteraceae bacterium H6797]
MALSRITSFAFSGIEAIPVEVQVQIAPGMPAFTLVGLPDKTVAESRERVRAVMAAMGLSLPPKRVLVNLSPAAILKEGPHFDLPIALGIFAAMGILPIDEIAMHAAMGELALDGRILPVPGILPAAIASAEQDLSLICPQSQGSEARWAGEIEVIAAPTLVTLLNHLQGKVVLQPPPLPSITESAGHMPCLSEVKGQETAKRALEIAAAGRHNLMMTGSPGAGKSMLAARLPGLLPPLSPAEALEISLVRSIAGMMPEGKIDQRPPFREPHHSATQAALIGGGPKAKPGEVSLAHRGVLFLDELPEFPRPALEALRQPLETGRAVISRAATHVVYPAKVQLIAAMNPCRCGYLGDASKECGRAPNCGADYQGKLSGPLLDRIDMAVEMSPIPPSEMARAPRGETSAVVARRVVEARAMLEPRWGKEGPANNAEASLEELQPTLANEALTLAETAAEKLRLSNRGFIRALRVARSIADLDGSETVRREHVSEALAFRLRGLTGRQG